MSFPPPGRGTVFGRHGSDHPSMPSTPHSTHAADPPEVMAKLEQHIGETEDQIRRLERILEDLDGLARQG
ncbi:DUF892 family protein (plasmid) [Rhizobium sp. AB2/73]|uniref:DUF892 family protein n=1 Tax=Rhizobium TaxID=379 RepID=UPI0009F6E37F|nr:DUF892 family protein [Rhizobium sp. AB2/73]UEQ83232.1 DUF892 family protein [Rhizobium sp. AB2/73]